MNPNKNTRIGLSRVLHQVSRHNKKEVAANDKSRDSVQAQA